MTSIEEFENQQALNEIKEQSDAVNAIKELVKTKEGMLLFHYLVKILDVGELPDHLEDAERLGFLRTGKTIYNLLAMADLGRASQIFADVQIEKQRILNEHRRIELEQQRL